MPLYDSAVVKVYFIPILHLALPKLMLLCTVQCSSSLSHTPHTPRPCLQLYKLCVAYCICYCQLSQCWEVASRIELVCLSCLFADQFYWYKWCKYDATVAFSSAIKNYHLF